MLTIVMATLLLVPEPILTPAPVARVRPLSSIMRTVLNDAVERSATIVRLIDELQAYDVIVFVDMAMEPLSRLGATSIMNAGPSGRMLRIIVNARMSPARRIEILGHELQHALEIARAAEVTDSLSFRNYYLRTGYQVGDSSFETDEARAVELQVRADLTTFARPAAPGSPKASR